MIADGRATDFYGMRAGSDLGSESSPQIFEEQEITNLPSRYSFR